MASCGLSKTATLDHAVMPPPSCVSRSQSARPSRRLVKPIESDSSAVGGSSTLNVCLIHDGTLRHLSRSTNETPADGAACEPPSIGTYIENLGSTKLSSKTWYAGVVRPPASALMVRSAATSLGGRSGILSSPVGSFSCTTNDSPSKSRSAKITCRGEGAHHLTGRSAKVTAAWMVKRSANGDLGGL